MSFSDRRELKLRARIDQLTDQRATLYRQRSELRQEIHRLKRRLRDVTAGRDRWRERALAAEWALKQKPA